MKQDLLTQESERDFIQISQSSVWFDITNCEINMFKEDNENGRRTVAVEIIIK